MSIKKNLPKILFIFLLILSRILADNITVLRGAIVRGDTSKKQIALVFTGHEFADGGEHILNTLEENDIKGAFFFTGKFYAENGELIKRLKKSGHYLGPHSFGHLLYCDWSKRDSLLVSEEEFTEDLNQNYEIMASYGIRKQDASIFLPPFEWYNDTIASWCDDFGVRLINISSGTLSHTDYTFPSMKRYWSSDTIYQSIMDYEEKSNSGLNGFILLIHIGTDPERTDKFYFRLDGLIDELRERGYGFVDIEEMLE